MSWMEGAIVGYGQSPAAWRSGFGYVRILSPRNLKALVGTVFPTDGNPCIIPLWDLTDVLVPERLDLEKRVSWLK